tara:strand:- start:5197 stop:5571 length:375 start_codon:yes stop_codon:yes gene_type:complete
MSGISRSSVTALPKTGTITSTPVGQGESQTITGAKEGETWKIIGITFNNESENSAVMRINMIDAQGNLIELSDDTTCGATARTPLKSIFTTGELIVDYNVKLQAVFVSGDADAVSVDVAHVKIN